MAVNKFVDKFFKKILGTNSEVFLKKTATPIVAQINALEPSIKKLSDEELKAKTEEFKARVQKATRRH